MQRDRFFQIATLAGHGRTNGGDIRLDIHALQQLLQDASGDLLDVILGCRSVLCSLGSLVVVDDRDPHQRLLFTTASLKYLDRNLVTILTELGQRQLDRLGDSASADLNALHIILVTY